MVGKPLILSEAVILSGSILDAIACKTMVWFAILHYMGQDECSCAPHTLPFLAMPTLLSNLLGFLKLQFTATSELAITVCKSCATLVSYHVLKRLKNISWSDWI